MSGRFQGLTNNGGSRGDKGRSLRRLYTDHGITPPADLGARKGNHQQGEGRRERHSRHPRGHRTQISSGVERWDPE